MRFLLVSLLLLAACRSDAPERRHAGTERMAATLAQLAATSDPARNTFLNTLRAEAFGPMPASEEDALRWRVQAAQEWLRAGHSEKAIELLADAHRGASARGDLPPQVRAGILQMLAMAYLRLGEQENCVANPNTARCLLPVSGEGVHTLPRGSQGAIRYFEEVLQIQPDNLTARWLLNLAHMTLGSYPEAVPAPWRIPPEAFEAEYDIGRFAEVAANVGMDVQGLSGGVAVDDFTGDGLLDVVVSSWGLRDPIRFFVNDGKGAFTEATAEAGLAGLTGGLNLRHADYDNDGDMDVLVLRGAWLGESGRFPNSLLQNDGTGRFQDVTEEAGLLSFHPTQAAAFLDYDNDGNLDLFIGNESLRGEPPHPCELYRSNGDGTFTNVAQQAGVAVRGYVKGVAAGDYDNDGFTDLYLSRLTEENILLRNDGDGTFTDVTAQAGVAEPIRSFPTWFFDANNDGWLDLFVADYDAARLPVAAADVAADYLGLDTPAQRPRLYLNQQDGTFRDATATWNLDRVFFGMGSNFGDLDNDGWLDFYLGTGTPEYEALLPNRMFRNDGGRGFQDVTTSGGFGHLQKGHAVAFADLDSDGDQEVYAVMGGAYEGDTFHNVLFENPGHGGGWVSLILEGTRSNRAAIGARLAITVRENGHARTIHREVTEGSSFGGNPLRQHVGLGQATRVEKIEVLWPASGERQVFEGVAINRTYRVREGSTGLEGVPTKPIPFARKQKSHEHASHE